MLGQHFGCPVLSAMMKDHTLRLPSRAGRIKQHGKPIRSNGSRSNFPEIKKAFKVAV